MSDTTPLSENAFRADYYDSADFSHWLKKIEHSSRKVASLKRDASKKGYLLDIYSTYLQLTEILLINIYANSEHGFAQRLFVSNSDLQQYFTEHGKNQSLIEWFLLSYDFGIEEKTSINNFEKKYSEHKSILEEVIDDYLKDFDFLNAYKHGYRVISESGNHTLALNIADGVAYKLGEFDTLLTYFSKENRKNDAGRVVGFEVYENTISVNIKRIIIKAMFITAALENMRLVLAAPRHQNKILLQHYYLEDEKVWQDSFGGFRSKEFKYYEDK